jgi:hypothetical protein
VNARIIAPTNTFRILLLAIYFGSIALVAPLTGPYEGAQVNLSRSETYSDWWGIAAPILPDLLKLGESDLNWFLFYTTLALSVFSGVSRLIPLQNYCDNFAKSCVVGVHYLVILFVLQGGRDGILLGFSLLGLGLIFDARPKEIHNREVKVILGFCLLMLAILFKIPAAPAILLALLFLLINKKEIGLKRLTAGICLTTVLIPLSLILSTQIRDKFMFYNSYPEQQVMFYDLAGIYCWSSSVDARKKAELALKPFRRPAVSDRTLCASLTPYGWDNLRLPWINWSENVPIVQIKRNDKVGFETLRKHWISTIFEFPDEWAVFKVNLLGQVLLMSNAYEKGRSLNDFFIGLRFESMVGLLLLPSIILDYFYLLSFFSILIISIVIFSRRIRARRQALLMVFVISGITINLITYVANNGRYAMPYLLLYLILQIREYSIKKELLAR